MFMRQYPIASPKVPSWWDRKLVIDNNHLRTKDSWKPNRLMKRKEKKRKEKERKGQGRKGKGRKEKKGKGREGEGEGKGKGRGSRQSRGFECR